MVKVSVVIQRKAGMTREEFSRYWKDEHGPLALRQHDFIRHIKKYVQCHQIMEGRDTGSLAKYDGIVELWADSLDEVNRAFASPGYTTKIQPDEKNFCDDTNVVIMVTEEVTMKE